MAKAKAKAVKVTLVKSPFGRTPGHAECVRGLGLRRMHHSVTVQDTPASQVLLERQADALQATYSLGTALTGKNLGRNTILDAGWNSYPWKRHAELAEG